MGTYEIAQQKMSERQRTSWPSYKVGNKVWLEMTNLRTRFEKAKLGPKCTGPFTIKEILGPLTFRLTLPLQWQIHDVFYATLLTPYIETNAHGPNYTNPPPDLVRDHKEYEVEAILSHKGQGSRRQYLIKWKGYPDSENIWKPEQSLEHASLILKQYKSCRLLCILFPSQ